MKKVVKKNTYKDDGVVIYQAKDGAIELQGDFKHETFWVTLDQISSVFSMINHPYLDI